MFHDLNPPIKARYIRFRPTAWHQHISMRVELYGCYGMLSQNSMIYCFSIFFSSFHLTIVKNNRPDFRSASLSPTVTLTLTRHWLRSVCSAFKSFQISNAVGIIPNLSFCFCHFLFTDSLSVIVCEGKTKEIRCESMSKIRVLWANYGRLNPKTCPHSSIKTINCRASISLDIVRDICQGKTACTLESNNGFFDGDPCGETHKYLLVEYICDNRRISHTYGSL